MRSAGQIAEIGLDLGKREPEDAAKGHTGGLPSILAKVTLSEIALALMIHT